MNINEKNPDSSAKCLMINVLTPGHKLEDQGRIYPSNVLLFRRVKLSNYVLRLYAVFFNDVDDI